MILSPLVYMSWSSSESLFKLLTNLLIRASFSIKRLLLIIRHRLLDELNLPLAWLLYKFCFGEHNFFLEESLTNWYIEIPPRHWNTGLVSSRASLTLWGEGASLALVGHPSSDGVTIKLRYGVYVLHRPASHSIFSYWLG